jgi:PRTRC genetic system protein E
MFFMQINQMMNQAVDVTLVIRKKEGQLMVSVMPKSNGLKDEAQNHIVPLTVTGTPQELDMGFLQTICQPIQRATGLLTNMSQFEQQADKAAVNSKAEKEKKDKEAKEAKEKKEKFDKLMKKASELEAEQKYADTIANLKQARTFATQQAIKIVDEKISAIRMKTNQGSLFEMAPAPEPQPQAQAQPTPVTRPIVQAQMPPQQTMPVSQPQPMVQQPVINGNAGLNNPQQPPVQVVNGNSYQAPNNPQPVYPGPQAQPQYNNAPVYEGLPAEEYMPEPPLQTNGGYATHREGEYDQYPDFPGYPNNNPMYNHQNA